MSAAKPPLIQHVSDTAFLVAHHRAVESARPDALFSDPLAARLAGDRGRAIAGSMPSSSMTAWSVAIRTVLIDDYLQAGIARGADTVVNLGAGLDTRPYRLSLPPDLHWVEVDYPEVIAFKTERLRDETPRCRLERVGLDLADVSARRALLARLDGGARRLMLLTEGVIPYLEVPAVGALADDLRALSHVDGWIVDYLSPESVRYVQRRRRLQMAQAPFRFDPPDWFGFFAQHGWKPRELRYLPVEGSRLGRPTPWPLALRLLFKLLGLITPAEKRDRVKRLSAYVLLEPAPVSPPGAPPR